MAVYFLFFTGIWIYVRVASWFFFTNVINRSRVCTQFIEGNVKHVYCVTGPYITTFLQVGALRVQKTMFYRVVTADIAMTDFEQILIGVSLHLTAAKKGCRLQLIWTLWQQIGNNLQLHFQQLITLAFRADAASWAHANGHGAKVLWFPGVYW